MSWARPGHGKSKNSISVSNPDDMPQMSMRHPDDIYTASPIQSPRKARRDRQSATPSATATLLEDSSPPQTPSAKAKGKQRESSSTIGTSSSVEKKKSAKHRGTMAATAVADSDPYPYPLRSPSPLDYDDTDDNGYPYASSLDPLPPTDSQFPLYGTGVDTYSVDAYTQHLRSLSFSSYKNVSPVNAPPPIQPSGSTIFKYSGVGPRKRDRSFEILNRVIKRMPTIESFGSKERDSRYRISTRAATPTSVLQEEESDDDHDDDGTPSGARKTDQGQGHRLLHVRGRSVNFDVPEDESEAEVEAALDDEDERFTESGTPVSDEYETPPSRIDLHGDDGNDGAWFDRIQSTGYIGRR